MRFAILVFLTGCLFDTYDDTPPPLEPRSLADTPQIFIDAHPGGVSVWLRPEEEGSGCATVLPSFRATVSGMPMHVDPGRQSDYGLDSPDWQCETLALGASLTATFTDAQLEVSDNSMSFHVDLGDVLLMRTLELPAGHQWTRGATYDVRVASVIPFDLQVPDVIVLETRATETSPVMELVPVTSVDGDVLHVTVPGASVLPYTGFATLRMSWRESLEAPCPQCSIKRVNDELTTTVELL